MISGNFGVGDIVQEGDKRFEVIEVTLNGYILNDVTNKPTKRTQKAKAAEKEGPEKEA